MNFFLDNIYDSFKDRRYGALFLSAMLTFFGSLVVGVIVFRSLQEVGLEEYYLEAFSAIGLLYLAWFIWMWRRAWKRNREKLRFGPLSRDELRIARSKLRNGMNPSHRPAPRVPDTNLKY